MDINKGSVRVRPGRPGFTPPMEPERRTVVAKVLHELDTVRDDEAIQRTFNETCCLARLRPLPLGWHYADFRDTEEDPCSTT